MKPHSKDAVHAATTTTTRVLVVDDDIDSAEMLATLLRLMGHSVRMAHDGIEAVRVASEFQPDAVLLDISLPRMDGYEAAQHIRGQHGGSDVLLLAITGWGEAEDHLRSKKAGFDHHLVKPVDPSSLHELLGSADRSRDSRR